MALAEKAISKAIELQPGDAGCHLLFSIILSSQIRDDEAEIQLREALLLEPMNPLVHCGYARLYYIQGKIKECRDHVQQALMLDAENEEALDIRSKLNQAQQRGSTYMNLAAKTDIKGVLDALKEKDYYASSRISVRMERNARDAFRLLPEEEVFAIIDMAIIRKGRAGLLFTDKGIYSKTIGSLHIIP